MPANEIILFLANLRLKLLNTIVSPVGIVYA